MGRATIVSGGTDGRYTISVDTGAAQKAARVASLTTTIAALATKISDLQSLLTAAEAAVVAAQAALASAITQYVLATQASPGGSHADELKAYLAAEKTLFNKQATAQPLRSKMAMLQAQKKAAEKDKIAVLAVQVDLSREAWCADLTENGTGLVGTIEIPGESDLILIKPACPAPVAGDGSLLDRRFMSPEQAFWNAAVLPGWQKFKPTYRWGTITALDIGANTANVTLGAVTSSAQRLGVDQTATLVAVPVEYMTCNAAAFEVGDNVVVQFTGQDWSAPKVIGFVTDPRPCITWPSIYVEAYHTRTITDPGGTRYFLFYANPEPACGPRVYASGNALLAKSAAESIVVLAPYIAAPGSYSGFSITHNTTTGVVWSEVSDGYAWGDNMHDSGRVIAGASADWFEFFGGASGYFKIERYWRTAADGVTVPTNYDGSCGVLSTLTGAVYTGSGTEVVEETTFDAWLAAHGGIPEISASYLSQTKEYALAGVVSSVSADHYDTASGTYTHSWALRYEAV